MKLNEKNYSNLLVSLPVSKIKVFNLDKNKLQRIKINNFKSFYLIFPKWEKCILHLSSATSSCLIENKTRYQKYKRNGLGKDLLIKFCN